MPTAATGNNDVTNSGVFRDDSDVISTQHMPDVRVGRVQSAFLRDRCQQAGGGGGGGGGGMQSGMHSSTHSNTSDCFQRKRRRQ